MALGPEGRTENIELSIFGEISRRFENAPVLPTPGGLHFSYANRVYYNDPAADPSALDQRRVAKTYWMDVQIVQRGLGRKLPTIVQFDLWWAAGDFGTQDPSVIPGADRFGDKIRVMGDDLVSVWSPNDQGFPLLDFANLNSPVRPSDNPWIIVRASNGQLGWPEERLPQGPDRGLWREIFTYQFWLDQDLHPSQPVYF